MVSIETLKEQFDELGCEPNDQIIEKCLLICESNNVDDPVEFVEKWMTYSISKFNGAEPTLEYLEAFERHEIKNQQKPVRAAALRQSENFSNSKRMKIEGDSDEEESNILGAYITVTPKNQKKSVSRITNGSPELTPTRRTPVVVSDKSGNVVYSFGNFGAALELKTITNPINLEYAEMNDGTQWLSSDVKYLTANMRNDGPSILKNTLNLGKEFSLKILADEGKKDDEEILLSPCDDISQNSIRCLGKIIINEGRKDGVTFIGYDENKSRTVQLDLSRMPQAHVFSGQVCIIEGTNPRGRIFYPSRIYCERIIENPEIPVVSSPIQIMIASGPFTEDDLMFDYLDQLLAVCQNNKPELLILSGAFFDKKSKTFHGLVDDVEDKFNKILKIISEKVGESTKVVIVTSLDDINSSACYPTSPYKYLGLRKFKNIFYVSDPSIINVNGIKVGINSVDVLQQFSENEFCINAGADKIRRYVNNIFHQKSFYPIFPHEVPSSLEHLYKYGSMNKIPNILILPSDSKYFIRDINGCLCVNPGRSSNQGKLGTFARVMVQSPKDNTQKFMSAQIVNL